MEREFVTERYGDAIELGPCVVGRTIDHVAVRGFAPLDKLALISAPDVFDDEINPTGTQRELKKAHAESSFKYATGPRKSGDTRAFPEVILNVRSMHVVEIRDLASDEALYFDSHAAEEDIPKDAVKVVIDLEGIEFPKSTIGPDISRVDGNHRLDGPERYLDDLASGATEDTLSFPTVPFMLFLDLKIEEELTVFNDFNSKHEGMESSLLITQNVRLKQNLKDDPKRLPEWIGFQLTRRDRAFSDIAFVGGSKEGAREAGKTLRLNLSAIRTLVALMIRHSGTLRDTLAGQPEAVLNIIDSYWKAVAKTFPEAWSDKKNYILLQSIGLNGFAEFGGRIVDRQGDAVDVEDFAQVLESIKPSINLERSAHPGVAGAGGASVIAGLLRDASSDETLLKSRLLKKTLGTETPTADQGIEMLEDASATP